MYSLLRYIFSLHLIECTFIIIITTTAANAVIVTVANLIEFLNTEELSHFYFKFHCPERDILYRRKYVLNNHTAERALKDLSGILLPKSDKGILHVYAYQQHDFKESEQSAAQPI